MSRTRMPALFLGHGSPMNVLEDNMYTRAWGHPDETLPRPKFGPRYRRYSDGDTEDYPWFRRLPTDAV